MGSNLCLDPDAVDKERAPIAITWDKEWANGSKSVRQEDESESGKIVTNNVKLFIKKTELFAKNMEIDV